MTTDSGVIVVATDMQLAVSRLGGSPLNIQACLQRVLAGVSPGCALDISYPREQSLEPRARTPE